MDLSRSRNAQESAPTPAPASSNVHVDRALGGKSEAINCATGAGVMNCPSADFRFRAIPGAIALRTLSAWSSS